MIISFNRTIAAAATPEPIRAKGDDSLDKVAWLVIQNNNATAANAVFVGPQGVTNANGLGLKIPGAAGASFQFPPVGTIDGYRLHEIYLATTVNGQSVTILACIV
jgi:hypothetical protein